MWPSSNLERSSTRLDTNSQHETFAEGEHNISTIAGSLASITLSQCIDEPVYDTDHTDLNSDFDEAELRRELLNDKWRTVFDSIDPEGFGEIPADDFIEALKLSDLQTQVPLNKREILYELAVKVKEPGGPGIISFQDFVNVMCEGCRPYTLLIGSPAKLNLLPCLDFVHGLIWPCQWNKI